MEKIYGLKNEKELTTATLIFVVQNILWKEMIKIILCIYFIFCINLTYSYCGLGKQYYGH